MTFVPATDLASLCGKDLEVSFAKYGASPLKAGYRYGKQVPAGDSEH